MYIYNFGQKLLGRKLAKFHVIKSTIVLFIFYEAIYIACI